MYQRNGIPTWIQRYRDRDILFDLRKIKIPIRDGAVVIRWESAVIIEYRVENCAFPAFKTQDANSQLCCVCDRRRQKRDQRCQQEEKLFS